MEKNLENKLHNYTKCPVCDENVSFQESKCPVCEEDFGETKIKKNKKISFKAFCKNFIVIFLVFNIVLFAGTLPHRVIGSPYPVARVFMNAAATINMVYFYPDPFRISASFFRNTLYAPLFALRDGLYETGLKFIPENDLEREVWWGKIQYFDYIFLFHKGDYRYSAKSLTIMCRRELNKIEKKYGKKELDRIMKLYNRGYKSRRLLTSEEDRAAFDYKSATNVVNNDMKDLQEWTKLIDEHVAEWTKPGKIYKDKSYQAYVNNGLAKLLVNYPLVRKKYYYITYGKAEGPVVPAYLYKFKGEIDKLKKYYAILKPLDEWELNRNKKIWTDENNPNRANIEMVSYSDRFDYLDPILLSDYKNGIFSCKSGYYKDYLLAYKKMNEGLSKPKIIHKENIQVLLWLKQASDMEKNYKLFTGLCK